MPRRPPRPRLALAPPGVPSHDVPLVASGDDELCEAALRWCAAAGVTPEVVHDETGMRRAWRSAAAVLVGQDLAVSDLPRRDRVVLVSPERSTAWAPAVAVGASSVAVVDEDDDAVLEVLRVLDGGQEGCLVSVVPAVGGAGASTFTTFLAREARHRGLESALVDVDPCSGGLDVVLGVEHVDGARWSDLADVDGPVGVSTLRRVLPRSDGVAVLAPGTGGALPSAGAEVVEAAVRAFDVVVADVPRGARHPTAEAALSSSLLAVLVVPERVHAVAAARHTLQDLRRRCASVVAVSVAASGGTGPAAVADVLEVPVVARLRWQRGVGLGVEAGRGPGGSRCWRRGARCVLDLLGLDAGVRA